MSPINKKSNQKSTRRPIISKKRGAIRSRPLCEAVNCKKQPNFGMERNKARFCSEHKQTEMIDVIHCRCEAVNCKKQPSFAMVGKKARFCSEHKQTEMINVHNRQCEAANCIKIPAYGIEGDKARFCAGHKQTGMIDLKHCRCEAANCIKIPAYGIEGDKARFCADHKATKMINVVTRRCEAANCNKIAAYGVEGEKARFCGHHKATNMINVLTRRCESEACAFYTFGERTFVAYRVDGKALCGNCFSNLYPERTRLKVRKEQFILSEIERRIPELSNYIAIWDCALGDCTLTKPDMYWFIQQIGVHIEIDEHGLDHEDDDHRVAQIHAASGMDGTYLMRFNPDEYLDVDGNTVPSCFRRIRLPTGDPRLEATPEFERRMDIFETEFRHVLQKAEEGVVPGENNWKTQLFFGEM